MAAGATVAVPSPPAAQLVSAQELKEKWVLGSLMRDGLTPCHEGRILLLGDLSALG